MRSVIKIPNFSPQGGEGNFLQNFAAAYGVENPGEASTAGAGDGGET